MLPGTGITELSISPSRINPGPPSVNSQCRTACAFEGAVSTNLASANLHRGCTLGPHQFHSTLDCQNAGSATRGENDTFYAHIGQKCARCASLYSELCGKKKSRAQGRAALPGTANLLLFHCLRAALLRTTRLIIRCRCSFESLFTRRSLLHLSSPYSLALC